MSAPAPRYILAGLSLGDAPADRDGVTAEDYLSAVVEYDLSVIESKLLSFIIPKSNPFVHAFGPFFGAPRRGPFDAASPTRMYQVPWHDRGLDWSDEPGAYRLLWHQPGYRPSAERERIAELVMHFMRKAGCRPFEIDDFERLLWEPFYPRASETHGTMKQGEWEWSRMQSRG